MNYVERSIKLIARWKFHIIVVLAIVIIPISIVLTMSEHSNVRGGSIVTEDESVQSAIYSMMADPDIPIFSLNGSDPRIVGFTACGDDPSRPIALTQDMSDGGLVSICISAECVAGQGTPHPVNHYMVRDTTEYWYCVHDDGKVWGYKENCISQEGIDCEKVRIIPNK